MGLPWGGCDLSGQLPRQQGGVEEQGLGRAQRQEVGHCAVTVCLGLPLCSPDVGGEAAVAPLRSTGSRDRKGPPCKENRLATAAQARITQAPGEQESDPQPRPPSSTDPSRLWAFPLPRVPPLPLHFLPKGEGSQKGISAQPYAAILGRGAGTPAGGAHMPIPATSQPCQCCHGTLWLRGSLWLDGRGRVTAPAPPSPSRS